MMVDEIHRFTRPQQDLFLPYVENGWVQLIGATTENPSFKVNGALLSRCQVFTLAKHTPEDLEKILANALKGVSDPPRLPDALIPFLAEAADGDARQALNGFELALQVCAMPVQSTLDEDAGSEAARAKRDEQLMEAVRRGLRKGYNRSGDERYDMISALHKSIRGSDGSAAMYWLGTSLICAKLTLSSDAGRRRGSTIHCPPACCCGLRGRRSGEQRGAAPCHRSVSSMPVHRDAGVPN